MRCVFRRPCEYKTLKPNKSHPIMSHALQTLLATLGTLPAVAGAHDAFVGPVQAFLQHGLDGPITDLQALIDRPRGSTGSLS